MQYFIKKKITRSFCLFCVCILILNQHYGRRCNSDKFRINILQRNSDNIFSLLIFQEKLFNMDIEKVKKIEVMRNSIKFLRICSIFPTEYEINHPEKNVHIRYTMMNIVGSYFPIGIILHLINNIKSKYFLRQ